MKDGHRARRSLRRGSGRGKTQKWSEPMKETRAVEEDVVKDEEDDAERMSEEVCQTEDTTSVTSASILPQLHEGHSFSDSSLFDSSLSDSFS